MLIQIIDAEKWHLKIKKMFVFEIDDGEIVLFS